MFSTVANHPASDWPATAFLLCGTRPGVAEVLKRLAMPVFLPLYDTVEEALDQVAARLNVIDRAELLADELVTNAVVHARTSLRVRLELRGDLLHIGVHDASPRLLRVVPDDPDSETGRGLRLVEQLAAAWGVHRGRDGGKVVWCTLRLWRQPGPNGRSRP